VLDNRRNRDHGNPAGPGNGSLLLKTDAKLRIPSAHLAQSGRGIGRDLDLEIDAFLGVPALVKRHVKAGVVGVRHPIQRQDCVLQSGLGRRRRHDAAAEYYGKRRHDQGQAPHKAMRVEHGHNSSSAAPISSQRSSRAAV